MTGKSRLRRVASFFGFQAEMLKTLISAQMETWDTATADVMSLVPSGGSDVNLYRVNCQVEKKRIRYHRLFTVFKFARFEAEMIIVGKV